MKGVDDRKKMLTKSRSMRRVRRGSIVLCIIYFNNYYNLVLQWSVVVVTQQCTLFLGWVL